jgi:hypothetical protein
MYLFVHGQWDCNYKIVIGRQGIGGSGKKENAEVGMRKWEEKSGLSNED